MGAEFVMSIKEKNSLLLVNYCKHYTLQNSDLNWF